MIGDIANQTDNLVNDPKLASSERTATTSGRSDDRLVFTEQNPARALTAAAYVAAGARAMRGFDDGLAAQALRAAEGTWRAEEAGAARAGDDAIIARLHAATELFLSTSKDEYRRALLDGAAAITGHVDKLGWIVGRALPAIGDRPLQRAAPRRRARVRPAVAARRQGDAVRHPVSPGDLGRGLGHSGSRRAAILPAPGLPRRGQPPMARSRRSTSCSACTRDRTPRRSRRAWARAR